MGMYGVDQHVYFWFKVIRQLGPWKGTKRLDLVEVVNFRLGSKTV